MQRQGNPLTLNVFASRKRAGQKLVVLTAYDLTSALIASAGGVDALLVGDSLGMVVLGYENTLPVTMDEMVHHCRAVARARPGVPIIADMPYGSFHVSPAQTVANALRLVKEGGAHAVKIEGGRQREADIRALLRAEIPVMGHLGLTPQSVNRLGGYKVQGRGESAGARLQAEAQLLADCGCFALVLECVPAPLAAAITEKATIPTIGIGAGAHCDGQVLVFHDLLGLFSGFSPRFVKRYAELGDQARLAISRYVDEVREGVFPGPEHEYSSHSAADKGQQPDRVAAKPGDDSGYLQGMEAEKG